MKYRVTHTTEYAYEGGEVSSSYSVAHLVPRRLGHQTCLSSDLAITPAPLEEVSDWVEDYRELWERRLDRLEEYLRGLQEKGKPRRASRRRKPS